MSKKKLMEEIKLNPARYYRMPSDVGRDRRFNNDERAEILAAWENEIVAMRGHGEEASEALVLTQVKEARRALGASAQMPPSTPLHEPAKFGPFE
jgi:hypothetical protein